MKILDLISAVDELKPNTYSVKTKYDWINRLERMIKNDIIDTHCGYSDYQGDYDPDLDTDVTLLAPPPYDEMYIRWLEAQIDLANGEVDRYNISITLYNTCWQSYADYYHRTHMPRNHGRIRF